MLIIISLIYSLNEVTSDVNVALNKATRYCGTTRMNNKIVDGIIDVSDVEVQAAACPVGRSFVEVSLGHEYNIHYAIAYEGRASESQAGALDYFQVECRSEDTHVHYCSIFQRRSVGPTSEGMRINCRVGKCDAIRLYSQKNVGLAVAEFEVYTLGSLDEGITWIDMYFGCFGNFQTITVFSPFVSVSSCLASCRERLHPLAGIDDTRCVCGTLLDGEVNLPDVKCYRRCLNKPCGGEGAYSVYIVNIQLPYYHGCHVLNEVEVSRGDMTLHKCMSACPDNLLTAIKNGNECACSDAPIDPDYFDQILCNISCTGDDSIMCGGTAHYSVFDAMLGPDKIRMITLFKCSGIWNQHGICQGNCTPGYSGPYCIEYTIKDCEVDMPCAEIENSECSVTADHQYACNCISGFRKNEITGICEVEKNCEVDMPCAEIENSECSVTADNQYACNCKSGFRKNEITGICEGERVEKNCEIDMPCAEIENSVCSVTADNQYACNCKSGFRKNQITGICEEIVEKNCEIDMPCAGTENSECSINADNQYECNCKFGFLKNETTEACEDIDECYIDDKCGHGTSGCTNTMGSYKCDCLSGYIAFTDIVCLKNDTGLEMPFSIPVIYFVIPSLLSFLIFGSALFVWIRSTKSKSPSSSAGHGTNPSVAS